MRGILRHYLDRWTFWILVAVAMMVAAFGASGLESFLSASFGLDPVSAQYALGGCFFLCLIGVAYAYDRYRRWRVVRDLTRSE
jgi:4-hydroxybenzoate polyprenyltransferase